MELKHTDVNILLYDGKIADHIAILNLIQKYPDIQKKPLMIIADSVDGEALQFLVLNAVQGKKPWFAVKTPGFVNQKKDYLYDIAALTGAMVISTDTGKTLDSVTPESLGSAKTVICTKDSTTIIDGAGSEEDIENRISSLKATLAQVESDYEVRVLNERIAKLSGGIAVIKVGASTEAELMEKKYRYEDALAATRAAVEEGIVPGGGVTLYRIANTLTDVLEDPDENIGYKIVKRSLEEPLRQISFNAGLPVDVVLNTIKNLPDSQGLDARNGQYVNMIESGIIDPAKVTRSALENASSIACLVLTTETLIVEKPITNEKVLIQEGSF
jgi:chaperonin GroEL